MALCWKPNDVRELPLTDYYRLLEAWQIMNSNDDTENADARQAEIDSADDEMVAWVKENQAEIDRQMEASNG